MRGGGIRAIDVRGRGIRAIPMHLVLNYQACDSLTDATFVLKQQVAHA